MIDHIDPADLASGHKLTGADWCAIRKVVREVVERIDASLPDDAAILIEEGPKNERTDGLIIWVHGATSAHELMYSSHVLRIDNAPNYVVFDGGAEEIANLILSEFKRATWRAEVGPVN